MASAIQRLVLSSSTDGKPLNITATVLGSAQTIHTCSSSVNDIDEVWIYATNNTATAANISITTGTAGVSDYVVFTQSCPGNTSIQILVPGNLNIKGNVSPVTIKAFTGTTTAINITGFVNRITI